MSEVLSFEVAKRRREPIEFRLGGDDHLYSFEPVKQAEMVLPLIQSKGDLEAVKTAFSWLDKGLSQNDQDHMVARLRDPEDDLDTDTIEDVVEKLIEAVSGRPTT